MYRFSVVFALTFVFNGANGCHSLSCDYECDFLDSIKTNAFDFNKNDSLTFSGLTHGQNVHSIFVYQLNDAIRLYCVSGLESGAGCSNFTDHTIDILEKNNRERRLKLVEYFLHVLDPKCELLMAHESQPLTHVSFVLPYSTIQSIHNKFLSFLLMFSIYKYNRAVKWFIVHRTSSFKINAPSFYRTPAWREHLFWNYFCAQWHQKMLRMRVVFVTVIDNKKQRIIWTLTPSSFAVMFFSDFCTLATIFIYGFQLDLRNTYRKLLLGYFCSFFVSHISATALQINDTIHVQPHLCKIAGYFVYFGFLTTFLWLNIISIDLWLSFRWLNSVHQFGSKNWNIR